MALSLAEAFGELEDPRIERNKKHKLLDIMILTICAVISGAEGWEDIERFGLEKQDWLRQWLELENGIPSHDCIARVIARLDPTQLRECFIRWVRSITALSEDEVVAIDGKTLRGSHNRKTGLKAIHMVSAWASGAGVSLGQLKTAEKSNEITAIPQLLELLEIKGCIVTIDAMGTQTAIAEKIIEKQAGYVLALKANQKQLHEAVCDYFDVALVANNPQLCQLHTHENCDAGHGRIEIRRCYLSTCLATLPNATHWKGLKSIAMLECQRIVADKTTTERRYYITSLTDVACLAKATRAHWGIENSLHWVLDVSFNEDDSRIRSGFAPENFNCIRQIVVNLLKNESSKLSIRAKRMKAALSDSFREKAIFSA